MGFDLFQIEHCVNRCGWKRTTKKIYIRETSTLLAVYKTMWMAMVCVGAGWKLRTGGITQPVEREVCAEQQSVGCVWEGGNRSRGVGVGWIALWGSHTTSRKCTQKHTHTRAREHKPLAVRQVRKPSNCTDKHVAERGNTVMNTNTHTHASTTSTHSMCTHTHKLIFTHTHTHTHK